MHLLMTADTVGGVWTYALELARAVAAYDVSVTLATMGARLTSDQRLDASRLDNLEVFESDYRLEWMDDAWDDVADAGIWLWEIARDVRPDVVHLNQFAHGLRIGTYRVWSSPIRASCRGTSAFAASLLMGSGICIAIS
jgi:hypothetical protein